MFVSVDPGPAIESMLLRFKRQVRQLAGEQLFLNDPPHLTVYLAHFPTKEPLLAAVAKLAAEVPAITIKISGWHIFANDQLTGRHTLVAQFDDYTQSQLRSLQQRVIGTLAPLRNVQATTARYTRQFQLLSRQRRESIEDHGFPFTGADWHPHFTVASVRPDVWPRVADEILPKAPKIMEACSRLTVYELEDSEPIALISHPLRSHEVAA